MYLATHVEILVASDTDKDALLELTQRVDSYARTAAVSYPSSKADIRVVVMHHPAATHEMPALLAMWHWAGEHLDHALLYLHTKGAGKPYNLAIEEQRQFATHMLARCSYEACLDRMFGENAVVCGVDRVQTEGRNFHYAGNFWWYVRPGGLGGPPARTFKFPMTPSPRPRSQDAGRPHSRPAVARGADGCERAFATPRVLSDGARAVRELLRDVERAARAQRHLVPVGHRRLGPPSQTLPRVALHDLERLCNVRHDPADDQGSVPASRWWPPSLRDARGGRGGPRVGAEGGVGRGRGREQEQEEAQGVEEEQGPAARGDDGLLQWWPDDGPPERLADHRARYEGDLNPTLLRSLIPYTPHLKSLTRTNVGIFFATVC